MTGRVQVYTLEDTAEHDNRNSLWVLIHGNVYDVTKYLSEHPGEEDVVLEQAGKHATEAFEDIGHSTDARNILEQHKIGVLCEEDRKTLDEAQVKTLDEAQVKTLDEAQEKLLWLNQSGGDDDESSWKTWVFPISLALIATLLYRQYIWYRA